MVTKSCFDGDLHATRFSIRIDVIKKTLKCFCILKKARAFSFGADSAGRTAEIQIDFVITHGVKFFCCFDKMLRTASQDLRDQIDSFIILGIDIFSLAGCERTVIGRRNERCEKLVHVPVDLRKCISENISCDAFQRREIDLHANRGSSHMHQNKLKHFKSIRFDSIQIKSFRFHSTESIVSRGAAFL